MNGPRILMTDASGMEVGAEHADFCVLYLLRREVERGTVGDLVDRLMMLSDSADYSRRFAGKVALVVDGYNDDPRELYEIPEVCALIRAVDQQWSYWGHFFSVEVGALQLVFALLVDSDPVRDGKRVGSMPRSQAKFERMFLRLLAGGEMLTACHGFDPAIWALRAAELRMLAGMRD